MIKNIAYSGISATPSDYDCADGSLAFAANLIPEDGALSPLLAPKIELDLPGINIVVKYIHKVSSGRKNYIAFDEELHDVISISSNGASQLMPLCPITQITAIGNTLLILTDHGIEYFLWKGNNVGYLRLGQHLPELPITFGLQGDLVATPFIPNTNFINSNYQISTLSNDALARLSDQILAKTNKFIVDEATKKGRFIFPFLVRYAYRLYDGSLTMHSAPVLMLTSAGVTPRVIYKHLNIAGMTGLAPHIASMVYDIDYAVISSDLSQLSQWRDIVKSVDIFISAPIYTYNQSGECKQSAFGDFEWEDEVVKQRLDDTYTISEIRHENMLAACARRKFSLVYEQIFGNNQYEDYPVTLPYRNEEDIINDIKDCSQFYLLKSIPIAELHTTRTKIDISGTYLEGLAAHEVMTDDYDNHDTIVAKSAFVYNSRVNLSGLRKQLFSGFNAATYFTRHNTNSNVVMSKAYVYIKKDNKEIIIEGDSGAVELYIDKPVNYFYYPDPSAYKVELINEVGAKITLALSPHLFLNGAVYFNGWTQVETTASSALPSTSSTEQRTLELPNKIYTSEVNNPFFFPLLGINTIGAGEIIGISSAAKALSEGQFGQFPLYAFSTDGVWALEVSATGTYSAKQPITRDVCINRDSITQLDSSVAFATARGVMLLSGSQSQCISEVLNDESALSPDALPRFDSLLSTHNDSIVYTDIPININELRIPFREYIDNCGMLFDYIHQRIFLYNPTLNYSYVYSLKSRQWGMQHIHIYAGLNSYPEAIAQVETQSEQFDLVNFSETDATNAPFLAITRPLRLGEIDTHKTIDTIIQRGLFSKGHIRQVLYGSNDLINWHIVWSSQDEYLRGFSGTPYKAFRLVLIGALNKDERLSSCTIQYISRNTNQPR